MSATTVLWESLTSYSGYQMYLDHVILLTGVLSSILFAIYYFCFTFQLLHLAISYVKLCIGSEI